MVQELQQNLQQLNLTAKEQLEQKEQLQLSRWDIEQLEKKVAYQAFLSTTPVSERVNIEVMEKICMAEIDDFDYLGERVDTPDGSFIYIDRGAKVLAVAHRDSVSTDRHFRYEPTCDITIGKEVDRVSEVVFTPTLDDRLGCTILLDILDRVLPANSYDILLTEGEETGRSTAKYFKPPAGKEYNWMFQFDRGGIDAVHYQYTDPDWLSALKEDLGGVKIEAGMFSDICYLEDLAICGVNVGTAYYQYHSKNAWCDLKEVVTMVELFSKFFLKHKDTKFVHNEKEYGKHGKKYVYQHQQEDYISGSYGHHFPTYGSQVYGSYNSSNRLPPYSWQRRQDELTIQDRLAITDDEVTKLQKYKMPKGHLIPCECFACDNYWKERIAVRGKLTKEKNLQDLAKQNGNGNKKPNHYNDLCVCNSCRSQRGELCPHEFDRAACSICSPRQLVIEKGGETPLDKELPFRSTRNVKLSATKDGIRVRQNERRSKQTRSKQVEETVRSTVPLSSKLVCYWCIAEVNKLVATSQGDLICCECYNFSLDFDHFEGWLV